MKLLAAIISGSHVSVEVSFDARAAGRKHFWPCHGTEGANPAQFRTAFFGPKLEERPENHGKSFRRKLYS